MVAINSLLSLLQTPLIKLTVIWQVKARFLHPFLASNRKEELNILPVD
ncbi:MAG: hypothetical protein ACRC1Z_20810 [Waterburya sp.]